MHAHGRMTRRMTSCRNVPPCATWPEHGDKCRQMQHRHATYAHVIANAYAEEAVQQTNTESMVLLHAVSKYNGGMSGPSLNKTMVHVSGQFR